MCVCVFVWEKDTETAKRKINYLRECICLREGRRDREIQRGKKRE